MRVYSKYNCILLSFIKIEVLKINVFNFYLKKINLDLGK